MTDDPAHPTSPRAPRKETPREARLAEALRENLRRRKSAAKSRKDEA
ncbi:ATP phosphoribosyltransferase [Parvularcula bermudensis HTCC2503]|uniref:ATP phosphoribosyltransferase n=1 Tax=Parvularcula bermudensis (strain ATCC BAA-594 / HTCC2503 / KCTC 12087) TaxID=314260 RepID=E0TBY9_PARBH|nr:ATP phosphoribosyltransferase [Parvularcula bermudensis HTCC2503]